MVVFSEMFGVAQRYRADYRYCATLFDGLLFSCDAATCTVHGKIDVQSVEVYSLLRFKVPLCLALVDPERLMP